MQKSLFLLLFTVPCCAVVLVACLKSSECASNSDCNGDDVCSNGECVECEDDGDCADGETCADNACEPTGSGPEAADAGVIGECEIDADCPSGQTCSADGICGASIAPREPCCVGSSAFECDGQCGELLRRCDELCAAGGDPACFDGCAADNAEGLGCAPSDTIDCGGAP